MPVPPITAIWIGPAGLSVGWSRDIGQIDAEMKAEGSSTTYHRSSLGVAASCLDIWQMKMKVKEPLHEKRPHHVNFACTDELLIHCEQASIGVKLLIPIQ